MSKNPVDQSVGGVEEIISELHERGVRSGKEASERLLAKARVDAGDIVRQAEAERDRIVADGQREAGRITDAARAEAEQMLESFMASLPDLFEKRASRLLDGILASAFDPDRGSDTIDRFVALLDDDRSNRIKRYFADAEPESFVEGLLVMAMAFYADTNGIEHFTLDSNLKRSWAKLMGAPETDASVDYEFRDGIKGFTMTGSDGREIAVSPESIKHMAEAWAGEEFRDIYVRLAPRGTDDGGDG